MRNRILAGALLAACAFLPAAGAARAKARPARNDFKVTTVVLVRHAEKAEEPRDDPPLTEAGRARARELARVLAGSGVKAVFTSHLLRTRQTAEPLAAQLGLAVTPLTLRLKPSNPREVTKESIEEIVRNVERHAGGAVLVVGHTNSIPEVIRMLGGDTVPTIDEKKFDDLFVLTVYGRRKSRVVRMKYGGQS